MLAKTFQVFGRVRTYFNSARHWCRTGAAGTHIYCSLAGLTEVTLNYHCASAIVRMVSSEGKLEGKLHYIWPRYFFSLPSFTCFWDRGTINTSSWFYVKPRPVTALVLLFLNLLPSQNAFNALTNWVHIFKIWPMSSWAEKTSSNDIGKDGFTLLFLLIQWVYTTMSTINLVATF